MSRARTGPADAPFESLYRREYPRTVALAGLLGAEDPEDVAQEALVRLFGKRARLDDEDAAVAYLRTIVVNLVRTEGRRRTLGRALLGRFSNHVAVSDAESLAVSPYPDLLAAIRQLKPRQREALVLRYWCDLNVASTAGAMRLPVGTVKSHLSRALAILRGRYDVGGTADD